MTIKQMKYLEESAYQLENEWFKVIVLPKQGSNMISIYDKQNQVELLRTPTSRQEFESRRMLFGTPVLFPPNRIEDAQFVFNGKKYELEMNRAKENVHIHGFVHDKEWNVIQADRESNRLVTELRSTQYPHIINQFPHDFSLTMSVELKDYGIMQTLKITNNGGEKMPVGVGYHSTFNFPIDSSKLYIDVEKSWELNERHLPTGRLKEVENRMEFHNGINLKGIALDDVYPMTKEKTAIIDIPERKTKLKYTALKGFKHWVIFTSNGNENLLAVEPYSWVTNAPNLSQLPNELTGFDWLNSKETKEYITELKVEHY